MDIETLGNGLSLAFQGRGPFNSENENQRQSSLCYMTQSRDYWTETKKEVYLLICTKDRKYSDIRASFKKNSNTSTTAIVGMLSAMIASQIGAMVGIITPLVALLLYGLLKIGINVWCNQRKLEFSPTEKRKIRKTVEQENRGDRE